MDRNLCVVDVVECDILALALKRIVGCEIVEGRVREVRGDRGNVLLSNGRDENRIAEEELEIDAICSWILGEEVPKGMQNWCAVQVGFMEGGEEVIKEPVPTREAGNK